MNNNPTYQSMEDALGAIGRAYLYDNSQPYQAQAYQNAQSIGNGFGSPIFTQPQPHNLAQYQPPQPEYSSTVDQWWADGGEGPIHQDCMVLRAYLMKHGIHIEQALSMPAALVKELAKAYHKLEGGNLDTELVFGMMDDEA